MGGSSGSTSQQPRFTAPQRRLANLLAKMEEEALKGGAEATPFGGQRVAPLLPELEAERERLGREFDPGAFREEQEGVLQRILSGEPSFDLSPEVTESFFEKGVKAPLLRAFDEDIRPRIGASFAGLGGSFSTRKITEEGRALQGLQTVMAQELAKAQFQNQTLQAQLAEAAAGRQVGGLGLSEQFALGPLSRSGALQGALAPFQQQEQALATGAFQEFLRTAPENNPFIRRGLSQLGTFQPAFDTIVQPGTDFSGPAGLIGAGLGSLTPLGPFGGLIGGGIGSGLGSLF